MLRMSLLGCLVVAAAACGGGDHETGETAAPPAADVSETAPRAADADLLPGIPAFLAAHPSFGVAESTRPMPDWAQGPRQQVHTSTGDYLFYLQDGEVVTVYRNDASGRQELWRKPGA